MFGHDNHDDDNTTQGAPLPPASMADTTMDDSSSAVAGSGFDGPESDTSVSPPQDTTDVPAAATPTVSAGSPNDDLLEIKKEALQQLTPLVGHLDQTPEEKFRTTMMMIQAADNQSLIKTAHEAAEQIPDEKTRAQALLDIVNEINYFTQRSNSQAN
jgi:hypothetical protein